MAAYKNTADKAAKAELLRFIHDIKAQFRETVINRDPRRKRLSAKRGERILLDNNVDIFGTPIKDPKLVAVEKKRLDKLIEQIETEIADVENNALYRGSFEWRFEFPEVLDEAGNYVGFDAVIGNPPYGVREKGRAYLNFVEINYFPARKVTDSYFIFVVLAQQILRKDGLFSYIVPNTFCDIEQGVEFRKWFLTENQILKIYDSGWVFGDAVVDTVVFFAKNSESLIDEIKLYNKEFDESTLSLKELMANDGLKIDYRTDPKFKRLLIDILNKSERLGYFAEIKAGVKLYERGKGNPQQTVETMQEKPFTNKNTQPEGWRPLIRGGNINRYELSEIQEFVDYGPWLAAPRDPSMFVGNRIMMRRTDDVLRSTYLNDDSVCVNSCHNIVPKAPSSTFYILALLNSKLIQWTFAQQNPQMIGKTFAEIKVVYAENLPIITTSDYTIFDVIVNQILQEKSLDPAADTSALEAEIDQLVYALYGLTAEEIALVEG